MRLSVVMAVATVYTVLFAAVVLWIVLTPSFFGPQPDRLAQLGPGALLLAIGWAWLLRIRRAVERP